MLVFQATVTCRRLYLNSDLVHQITRDYHLKPQQRLSSKSNNGKVTSQAARGKIINPSIPKFKGIHGMITRLGIFLFHSFQRSLDVMEITKYQSHKVRGTNNVVVMDLHVQVQLFSNPVIVGPH